MASWYRITVERSCRVSLLCRRWYNSMVFGARTSTATRSGWPVSSQMLEEAGGTLACMRDSGRYMAARFFAAPVQPRTKEEPKGMLGRRLNEAITAKFIRLVTDEGHEVVSRDEALDRARRLDLDLVEVQGTAKPPVCKIMDFHKEKYKKEAMEKERAKAKSESTVRKGDVKEVRLEGNIEQKDIEVKAKTVRGMIERGYRVKCMALPSKQRGTEERDLEALLSRLTDLIEDVMSVESGPFVRNEQAYVVVRHVKFGSRKGGSRKKMKTAETTSGTGKATSTTPISLGSATIDEEAVEPMDIDEETEDEILSDRENDAKGLLPCNGTMSPVMLDPGTKRNVDRSSTTAAMMSDMAEKSPASKTVYSSMKGKLGSKRDQIHGDVPPKPSVSQSEFSAEDTNRYSRRESQRHDHLDLNQGKMPPNDSSAAPSYGIFSSPKHSTPGVRRMADVNMDREKNTLSNGTTPNIPKSKIETTGSNNNKTEQGGWGIFSKSISKPSRDNNFGQTKMTQQTEQDLS